MEQYKTCTKCKQVKEVNQFSKLKKSKDGFQYHCKLCSSEYARPNAEITKERRRQHYLENKQLYKQRHKEWVKNNPEKNAAIKRRYREANLEKVKASQKAWDQRNPEKVKQKVTKRRALKKQAKTYFISEKEIWHLYNSKCFFCPAKSDTIEHVIPLSRGGTEGIGNLVPACRSCNSSKHNKFITEWKKVRGW